MNYGHYELPALSEYVVTETVYPDPDAKEQITVAEWIHRENVMYDVEYGHKRIRIHEPYPTDVDLTFDSSHKGWAYVFNDDYVVVA